MNASHKYTVVVSGGVAEGQCIDQARTAFANLFNISVDKADIFFQDKPRVLHRNLEDKQAKAYAAALEKIGLTFKLVPQQENAGASQQQAKPVAVAVVPEKPHLELEPVESVASDIASEKPVLSMVVDTEDPEAVASTMRCPKCNAEQPAAEECGECGIIVEKYRQTQSDPAMHVRAARPSGEDAAEIETTPAVDDSARLPALGAAVGAAVVGALVWMLIAVSFGYELGIVAWGIGGAVGFAAAMLGGRGQVCGAVCGALALAAILGGKYLAVASFQDNLSSAIGGEDLWGTQTEVFFEELKVDAKLYQELDGSDESLHEFLYTRNYTESDNAKSVTQEEIGSFYEFDEPTLAWIAASDPDYEQWQTHTMQSISDYSTMDLVKEDFGILDGLFILLGIGTAFRLGNGNRA